MEPKASIREPHWHPKLACVCCGTYPGSHTLRFVLWKKKEIEPRVMSIEEMMMPASNVYEAGQFCEGCFRHLMYRMHGEDIAAMGTAWNVRKVY